MPDTTNHAYNAPEQGRENWHEPINANWRALDRDVEIRDDEESRSSYEPQDGAKYLATDTGTVYIGDGDSWNELGTLEFQGAADGVLDSGEFTHEGGTSTSLRISGVTSDETAMFDVIVGPASAPDWDGDYGFSYDWAREWDDDAGEVAVTLTVYWQTDPGTDNDLDLEYSIQRR